MVDTPNPLKHLPLVLALCVGLGASGTIAGLSIVSRWDEPLPQFPLESLQPEIPDVPGQEETKKQIEELRSRFPSLLLETQKLHRPKFTALAAVNLISSAVLFLGGLFVQQRSLAGLRLLGIGLVLSQAYTALNLAIQIWMGLENYQKTQELVSTVMNTGSPFDPLASQSIPFLLMEIGIVFAYSIYSLLLLGELFFYSFAQKYLRRPAVLSVFGGGQASD